MPATTLAGCRKIVVGSLARPAADKRRSRNSDVRSSTKCIAKKATPPFSPTASNQPSEAEAIRGAQAGEEGMFEYLYRLHCRRVYAVCLRMIGDATEAEDLTQEAFCLYSAKFTRFAVNLPFLLGCTDWRLTSCGCTFARSRYRWFRSKEHLIRIVKPARQASKLERLTC